MLGNLNYMEMLLSSANYASLMSCNKTTVLTDMDMREQRILYLDINLLKPTGHVTHQQFNIQQLYVLPTLYLCVLYLSENKQRRVPLIS